MTLECLTRTQPRAMCMMHELDTRMPTELHDVGLSPRTVENNDLAPYVLHVRVASYIRVALPEWGASLADGLSIELPRRSPTLIWSTLNARCDELTMNKPRAISSLGYLLVVKQRDQLLLSSIYPSVGAACVRDNACMLRSAEVSL